MFSGLIREVGEVASFSNSLLTVKAEYSPKIGDSIAINGACLTVVGISNGTFSVELSPESQALLAVENYVGQVHIEPAMMMGDRFEGHVVQGHIDIVGTVAQVERFGNSYNLFIKIPKKDMRLMIPKGSVAIDGVSLTINGVDSEHIRLTIIPHTMENTIFKNYQKGTRVNIESDLFARYIENILQHREGARDTLNWSDIDSIVARY
jgi:riboflavin synthase